LVSSWRKERALMTNREWSPDEPLGTETFDAWDEALDGLDEVEPDVLDRPEGERALDVQLVVDERELEELGADLDDPEQFAVLDGLMDDPDGLGAPTAHKRARETDAEGWDLDAELAD
jgi:hypothetical protein